MMYVKYITLNGLMGCKAKSRSEEKRREEQRCVPVSVCCVLCTVCCVVLHADNRHSLPLLLQLEALKKKIRNKASRSQIDEIIQLLALKKSEVKAFILYFRSIDHNHDGLIRCVLRNM